MKKKDRTAYFKKHAALLKKLKMNRVVVPVGKMQTEMLEVYRMAGLKTTTKVPQDIHKLSDPVYKDVDEFILGEKIADGRRLPLFLDKKTLEGLQKQYPNKKFLTPDLSKYARDPKNLTPAMKKKVQAFLRLKNTKTQNITEQEFLKYLVYKSHTAGIDEVYYSNPADSGTIDGESHIWLKDNPQAGGKKIKKALDLKLPAEFKAVVGAPTVKSFLDGKNKKGFGVSELSKVDKESLRPEWEKEAAKGISGAIETVKAAIPKSEAEIKNLKTKLRAHAKTLIAEKDQEAYKKFIADGNFKEAQTMLEAGIENKTKTELAAVYQEKGNKGVLDWVEQNQEAAAHYFMKDGKVDFKGYNEKLIGMGHFEKTLMNKFSYIRVKGPDGTWRIGVRGVKPGSKKPGYFDVETGQYMKIFTGYEVEGLDAKTLKLIEKEGGPQARMLSLITSGQVKPMEIKAYMQQAKVKRHSYRGNVDQIINNPAGYPGESSEIGDPRSEEAKMQRAAKALGLNGPNLSPQQVIQKAELYARMVSKKEGGIPPWQAMMAAFTYESGYTPSKGLSKLASEANNYFGIKWTPEMAASARDGSRATGEWNASGGKRTEQANFVKYDSMANSFLDYAHHVKRRRGQRYNRGNEMMLNDNFKDPKFFLAHLAKRGYSTKNYLVSDGKGGKITVYAKEAMNALKVRLKIDGSNKESTSLFGKLARNPEIRDQQSLDFFVEKNEKQFWESMRSVSIGNLPPEEARQKISQKMMAMGGAYAKIAENANRLMGQKGRGIETPNGTNCGTWVRNVFMNAGLGDPDLVSSRRGGGGHLYYSGNRGSGSLNTHRTIPTKKLGGIQPGAHLYINTGTRYGHSVMFAGWKDKVGGPMYVWDYMGKHSKRGGAFSLRGASRIIRVVNPQKHRS